MAVASAAGSEVSAADYPAAVGPPAAGERSGKYTMRMTPEQYTRQIVEACGDRLRSVLLYGSAAAGDYAGRQSDYNLLVVLDRLGLDEMDALAPSAKAWARAGNPPPLLFTETRLRQAADVFPIEILDMQQSHKVLHGEDPLAGLEVNWDHLRLEVEHELRGKLIQLRERYLLLAGRGRALQSLMIDSLGTFLVLFRSVLRLFEKEVPAQKMDALRALADTIDVDVGVFEVLDEAKRGGRTVARDAARGLYERYVRAIEQVVDAVDAYLHNPEEKASCPRDA